MKWKNELIYQPNHKISNKIYMQKLQFKLEIENTGGKIYDVTLSIGGAKIFIWKVPIGLSAGDKVECTFNKALLVVDEF